MAKAIEKIRSLKELFVGILIGIAMMVPGISGAVMAVAFGIYERIVRDIAHVHVYLKKDFRFLAILAAGVLVGTILSAKLLNTVLEDYPVQAQFLFAGLILGQMPAIYRMSSMEPGEKLTFANWIALILGFVIMGSMIVADLFGGGEDITVGYDAVGFVIMFAIGLVVAISGLVPGISHSTILMVFGLMILFTEAIGDLDMFLLIPLVLGIVVGAFGFSRVVNYALDNHHRTMSFLILGLTVGSLITLTVMSIADAESWVVGVTGMIMFVVGTGISTWFVKLGADYSIEETELNRINKQNPIRMYVLPEMWTSVTGQCHHLRRMRTSYPQMRS